MTNGSPIVVEDSHFEFLRLQKGNLDELAHDRARWLDAYRADLEAQFDSIAHHLPARCSRFLDIGSGLGGIDILIRRHYERRGMHPTVWLLDGERDPARMFLHRQTFNDMRVARDFHEKNGGDRGRFAYWTPLTFKAGPSTPYDLVVSFGSWCFHYPPSEYLPALLTGGVHADTVLILEVRSTKAAWLRELEEFLEVVDVVKTKPKWSRFVFRVRQK